MYRDFQFLTQNPNFPSQSRSEMFRPSASRPLVFFLASSGRSRSAGGSPLVGVAVSVRASAAVTHSLHFRRFFCSLFVRSFAVSFAAFVLRCCPLCHALIVLVKRKSPKWRRTNNWADEDGRQAGSREGTDDTQTLTFCRLVGDGERKEIVTRQNCLCEQVVHGSLPPSGNGVIP